MVEVMGIPMVVGARKNLFIMVPTGKHSVLEQIWIKGSYLDQRLSQHESFYPIGLKSARIEIPHGGSHYIDFSKIDFYLYKNNFIVITFKLILPSKKVPNVEDFNSCWY